MFNLRTSIAFTALYRSINIAISFLLIPLTMNYVKIELYGIWLVLSSIVTWMNVFDVGLGSGLRNKLSESLSLNNIKEAREYISTSYILLSAISVILFFILLTVNFFLDWNSILKIENSIEKIQLTTFVLILLFCIRFIVQNILTIFYAFQKSEWVELVLLIGSMLSLINVCVLIKYFEVKLLYLVWALFFPPIFSMLIATIWFFLKKKCFKISIKHLSKDKIFPLFSLGFVFFIIQISGLVMYSLTNFIILRLLDGNEVTKYNIVYKYFSIITLMSTILYTPLWSAFTVAFAKEDYIWIRRIIKKMVNIFLMMVLLSIVMLFLSDKAYLLWLGTELNIPFSLSLLLCLFTLVASWNGIFISFVNGIGKVKLQMYLSVISLFLTIPMFYYFAKYLDLGVSGVALSILFLNLSISLIITYQVYLIINKKANGIWTK